MSEQRHSLALNATGLGMWDWNVATGKVLFDEQWCAMLGYQPNELNPSIDTWTALLHPEDAQIVKPILDQHLMGETVDFLAEFRLRHEDGQWLWILANGRVVERNHNGAPLRMVGTQQNITDRKEAEQGLAAQIAWQRALTESANYAIISTSVEGVIQSFNPAAERMLGYRSSDMVGRENPGIFHDGDEVAQRAATYSKELGEQIEPGFDVFIAKTRKNLTNDDEWTYIHKSGTRFPVFLTISAIKDAAGITTGFMGLAQDISSRKKLEAQQTRLVKILEASQNEIYIFDAQSLRFEYVNGGALKNLGYTAEAIRTLTPLDLKPRLDAVSFEKLVEPLRRHEQEKIVFETEHRRFDGGLYPVEIYLQLVEYDGASVFLAVVNNITDRLKTQAELLAAKQSAEQANRSKSEFLANMSHEIRTPMNGVLGMVGLLLDTELSVEQRRYANTVFQSGSALLTLLNDILDFSKIEAGKLTLESLNFNLHSMLDDFCMTLALRAHEKGLEFGSVVAPEIPIWVVGDPGRLRQILTNLVGNAIKFTAQGEVVIRVSLVEETLSEVQLQFSVHDTGIGIPAEKLAILFNKFSQVDASTTRNYGGTGLGLAISKQLSVMMGGEAGVRSQLGRGSEFWFKVRLAKGVPAEPVA